MYTIKFSTELSEYLIQEYGFAAEKLSLASKLTAEASAILSDERGFDTEEIAKLLKSESKLTADLGEEIISLKGKTEKINEIYCKAEKKIERNIADLPVLIHGNIAIAGKVSDHMQQADVSSFHDCTESALLCDNTAVHEDWLLRLIVKDKYGV